jgi:hypothetical protein
MPATRIDPVQVFEDHAADFADWRRFQKSLICVICGFSVSPCSTAFVRWWSSSCSKRSENHTS